MSKIWMGGSLYFSMTGTRDEEVVARLRRCLGTLLVRDNVTKLCARTTTLSAAAVNGEYDNQVMVFYVSRGIFHLGGALSDSGDVILTRETSTSRVKKTDQTNISRVIKPD